MATRHLLAELCTRLRADTGRQVVIEAAGGVDAAKRVAAGEPFDVVVLASDAIDKLIAAGHLAAGSRVDLARSPVAVAVKAGAHHPDVGTSEALRQALLSARRIGCSTGPSGVHLTRLFERWGLAAEFAARTVQAPPGVPVAGLLLRDAVDIGLQQLSELTGLDGIDVLGPLPGDTAFITTFSAGWPAATPRRSDVVALLDFFNANDAVAVKRRHGMEPA